LRQASRSGRALWHRALLSVRVAIALVLAAIVQPMLGQMFFIDFETPTLPPGGYAEGSAASHEVSFWATQPNYDIFPWGVKSGGIHHPDLTSGLLPAEFGMQYAVLHAGGTFVHHPAVAGTGSYPSGTYRLTLSVAPQSDGYLDYYISINPHVMGRERVVGWEQGFVEVGWQERQYEFIAPEAIEMFYFTSNPNLDYDVFFDGISLVAIPEPSTAALFCAGFALCWCKFRLRQNPKTRSAARPRT
jgi:hypothetical protein